jgi:hypothetical protein
MRTPVGDFRVGSTTVAVQQKAYGLCVLGANIMPYQIEYLYAHGLSSLSSSLYSNMDFRYWGLDGLTDVLGLWQRTAASEASIQDSSGNAKDLTIVGSPTRTVFIKKPAYWAMGANFRDSTSSGLAKGGKHGLFSCYFKESAGLASLSVDQTVVGNNGVATPLEMSDSTFTDWTLTFWLKPAGTGDAIVLYLSDSNGTNTYTVTPGVAGQWKQYIITRAFGTPTGLTVRFQWLSGGAIDMQVDAVGLTHGKPYGTFSTPTENTGAAKPFVGSYSLVTIPGGMFSNAPGLTNFLDVRDIPGDAPAACRLFVTVQGIVPSGPIRIGSRKGWEPHKQQTVWHASRLSIIGGVSTYGTTFPDPYLTSGSLGLADKIRASLATLFPFPSDQIGMHKILIGHDSSGSFSPVARITTRYGSFPLTGDPVIDSTPEADKHHLVDAGLLSWPPASALSKIRSKLVTGRYRTAAPGANNTPYLSLAAQSETIISAPLLEWAWLILLPTDAGFYTMLPGVPDTIAGLQPTETLVIDTIDRDADSLSYVMERITPPGGQITRRHSLAGGDITAYGTGFYLEPDNVTAFWIVSSELKTSPSHYPFGVFNAGVEVAAWIEYQPRYLYV